MTGEVHDCKANPIVKESCYKGMFHVCVYDGSIAPSTPFKLQGGGFMVSHSRSRVCSCYIGTPEGSSLSMITSFDMNGGQPNLLPPIYRPLIHHRTVFRRRYCPTAPASPLAVAPALQTKQRGIRQPNTLIAVPKEGLGLDECGVFKLKALRVALRCFMSSLKGK